MLSFKVSKSDKAIRAILSVCYPGWTGRKVSVRVATQYQMADYWDGGSRSFVVGYELATGRKAETLGASQIPMNRLAHAVVSIPAGVALVEHSIFCGRDAGVTVVVRPEDAVRLLPSTVSPPALEGGARTGGES